MSARKILWAAFLVFFLFSLACEKDESDDGGTKRKNGEPSSSIVITKVRGTFGDIRVEFTVNPEDKAARSVALAYKGACAGEMWTDALTGGRTDTLGPGVYTIVWYSWDQEAGCNGEVVLRLTTDKNETAESAPFTLDNTDTNAGFFEFPLGPQGVQSVEEKTFEKALYVLLDDPTVDFVATERGGHYEVYADRGAVAFRREPTNAGYQYVVIDQRDENPIGIQDDTIFPTLEDELAAGGNPNNISIPGKSYPPGDPRLSFIEPENDSYPYAYERIAAYFDHPDSADFMINWKGYAHAEMDLGEHGSLDIVQSHSPLVFWGAGIEPGIIDESCRQVDIAPTVAKLLGMPKTYGVDERGVWSHDVYLQWQDGHVIEQALDGRKSKHVFILIHDGMTHTELRHQVEVNRGKLPNYARLFDEGAWSEYGSTTNWPSVTYPSHNTVGSSMYSGHHGIVDNEYYIRETAQNAEPISQTFFTSGFWNPIGPAETLHQAVHRVFGDWGVFNPDGAVTASLFDPSVVGATKADLEFRDKTHQAPFPPIFDPWPEGIPLPAPNLDSMSAYFEQFLGALNLVEIDQLFANGVTPMPTYVILNEASTDGFGHENGPHHDKMLNLMKYCDKVLGVLFAWLDAWGIANDTTIIVSSDHGMQLGDISRSGWPPDSLEAAGIKFAPDLMLGIYLKTMFAKFNRWSLDAGETQELEIWVMNNDTHEAAAGAHIRIDDGAGEIETDADATGYASVLITPAGDTTITITHPDFNDQEYVLKAK